MTYFAYYQNSHPTWGTPQYGYSAPPAPQFQPQPSWRGVDYYRAHAGNSVDHSLFDYVWFKMKNLVRGTSVGRNEATHWWKRVYGGLVDPSRLLAREIGAAAGYEAIRCWEHHKSIYAQPLSADRDREREALIGLATAEAARLWPYTRRPLDKYGRLEASEVAAATASRIFAQSYDYESPYEPYDRFPRERRSSITGKRYDTSTFLDDDDSDDDDDALFDSRSAYFEPYFSRRHSTAGDHMRRSTSLYRRARSPAPYGSGPALPIAYGSAPPSPVAYGGSAGIVGFSSAAISPYAGYSGNAAGSGIPGMYYPPLASTQQPIAGGYSPYGMEGMGGVYMNRTYAGSSVGLPPPPGTYLQPFTTTHRRANSFGSYGASMRPSFGY